MKNWGIFLIVVGIFCIFSAIGMDTSVETGLSGRVNNLGLMNIQTNLIIGGGFSFISGILLVGFSSKSEVSSSEQTRVCPYCAEKVKAQATICRFCQKDLPILEPKLESSVPNRTVNPPLDISYDNLLKDIIEMRDEGFSFYLISENFDEKNISIPEKHSKFESWSPELVKLILTKSSS